jgi:hypothetical protein
LRAATFALHSLRLDPGANAAQLSDRRVDALEGPEHLGIVLRTERELFVVRRCLDPLRQVLQRGGRPVVGLLHRGLPGGILDRGEHVVGSGRHERRQAGNVGFESLGVAGGHRLHGAPHRGHGCGQGLHVPGVRIHAHGQGSVLPGKVQVRIEREVVEPAVVFEHPERLNVEELRVDLDGEVVAIQPLLLAEAVGVDRGRPLAHLLEPGDSGLDRLGAEIGKPAVVFVQAGVHRGGGGEVVIASSEVAQQFGEILRRVPRRPVSTALRLPLPAGGQEDEHGTDRCGDEGSPSRRHRAEL